MKAIKKINNNVAICIDSSFYNLIKEIPEDIFEVAVIIVQKAQTTLK